MPDDARDDGHLGDRVDGAFPSPVPRRRVDDTAGGRQLGVLTFERHEQASVGDACLREPVAEHDRHQVVVVGELGVAGVGLPDVAEHVDLVAGREDAVEHGLGDLEAIAPHVGGQPGETCCNPGSERLGDGNVAQQRALALSHHDHGQPRRA